MTARRLTISLFAATALVGGVAESRGQAPRAKPVDPAALPTTPAGGQLSKDPETALIQYANYVYSQRQWALAADQYKKYLARHPGGKETPAAHYRLAECGYKQEDTIAAEQSYLRVVKNHLASDYAPAAAYRLGMIYYARNQFKSANPYFEMARKRSTKPEIQLHAAYQRALCLKKLNVTKESRIAFQRVVDFEGIDAKTNRFREAAMLSVARIDAKSGDQNAALASFTKLATDSTRVEIKGEALVKAGLISSSLGDEEKAKELLNQALDLRGAEEWKPDAQFHLIKTYYAEKDYKSVTEVYRKGAFAMPDDIRPKMLLMVGNSYRHMDAHRPAIDVYLILREHYPATREASEAEYRKLLCFYNMGNHNLPEYVDDFIEWQLRRNAKHKHIDMARLLKAEYLFSNGVYGPAGRSYDKLRMANIPEALRASALYKRGWAHTEGESHNLAIRAFSDFLEKHPKDPRVSSALAKRALSFRAVEDYTSALRDLEQIIAEHPESEATELAYQQSALIKGQQRDFKGMAESYEFLLAKYPESKAVPEAHFWIGWSHYEEKAFAEASKSLRKARELDRNAYFERATLRIILSEYTQQNIAETRKEIEDLPSGGGGVAIPPQVNLWLGVKLFEAADYHGATTFLGRSSTPDAPENTQPVVWKQLGQARLYTGKQKDAITAFDHYLTTHQPPTNRARVLHDKAVATLALGDASGADAIVEEALSLQPQSRVYGQLCLLWGEIALRGEQWERATQRLVKPTYAIQDEAITPTALFKSAAAHDALGQKEKAAELRSQLKEKFPRYESDEGAIKGLPAKA